MHALLINSEFCLWKSITIALKKKKKKRERERKRAFENADAESKLARNWLILWQNALYL